MFSDVRWSALAATLLSACHEGSTLQMADGGVSTGPTPGAASTSTDPTTDEDDSTSSTVTGATTGAAETDDPTTGSTGTPSAELLAVTLNTHSFQEGDSSLDKLALIGEGLAALDAHIVGLNEVMSGAFWSYDYGGARYDGTELIMEAAQEATGTTWYAAQFDFAHWDTGETMSNVVLSRTPILDTDSRPLTTTDFWPAPNEQRSVGYARTEVDGVGIVAVFVTHAWGWDSVDTEAQIAEVHAFMREKTQGDERLVLLLGDLNTPDSYPAYPTWLDGPPALVDTFAAANPESTDGSTIFGEAHRVDYVLMQAGDATIEASQLVFDGRDLPVVSDHKGVATSFSLR